MTVHFEHATRAAQGARTYQEDAADLRQDPGGLTAVLADGMGGHAGGAVASALASANFLQAFSASSGDVRARLNEGLDRANAAIAAGTAERPDLTGMGCTLIGAALGDGRIDWVSVGDSPLYLVRRDGIHRLNADHSLAPEIDKLAERGLISWDDARDDPRRHILRSALTGTEIELIDRPEAAMPLAPDDVVILASDGIHSITEAEIARVVAGAGAPDAAAEALLAAVAAVGHPHQDNTTVVVVRVVGS
ncbi:MAG TPA: SpoIIE family protein phosphatase [Hyphomicrobiaceae bacterium]|jgi:protein phosphatase|nr:SpoIIE family protein phosphatase [Hyphomicrobiaceae bacterium]